jgi:hypothetical protein
LLALITVGASPVGWTPPPPAPAAPPVVPALPPAELAPPLDAPPLLVVPAVLPIVVPPVDGEPPGPTGTPPVDVGMVVAPPLFVGSVVVVGVPPLDEALVSPPAPLPNTPPVPSNWFLLPEPESLEQADASNTVMTPKQLMVRIIGWIPLLVTNWLRIERYAPPARPGRN